MGALTIEQQDQKQKQLKDYLLGRLDEAEAETVEERLLSDENYSEELHILTNELVDQYVNNRVSAEDREPVERFIFESEARYEKFRFALALKKRSAELKGKTRNWSRSLRLYLPIAASILLVAGVGVWWKLFNRSDVEQGLSALRTAYRDQRPVDARVTGLGYAPILRGEDRVDSVQRDLAMTLLTRAAAERQDALSQHALGQYYLTQRQFEKAVEQLQASLNRDAKNAKTQNDLGVALLELGRQAAANNQSDVALKHYTESHEHLKEALDLDSSLLEARFNLALVLEEMGLPEAAAESWRKYIEQDSTSAWAKEAEQNLRRLEDRRQRTSAQSSSQSVVSFVEAYRSQDGARALQILSQNREVVTGKFIPIRLVNAYLEFAISGQMKDAENMLDALHYAGELEMKSTGDPYTAAVARFYRSYPRSRLATLVNAYGLASKGYELCQLSGFTDAIVAFEGARRAFASVGDEVEAAFVSYWLAYCYFWSKQIDESRSTTEVLIRYCREKNYKWLLAQSLSNLSNIQTSFHEQSEMLNLDREALSLTEQVNDAYGTQKYLSTLAGKYSALYNFPESLNYIARSLRLMRDFWPGTRQAWRNYDTATQLFNRMGLYEASAAYGEEALRVALNGSHDPSIIYLSYVHLGIAYGRLNNFTEGIRLAQSGLEIGQSLSENNAGKEITAYSLLQLGELYRQKGDLPEAVRSYDQAISLYDQLAFQTFKFVAHRGRLLTYLAQRNDSAAEQELQVVSDLFEEYRDKIKEDDNRTYFFDVVQEIYDAAIDFAHTRLKNDEAAFEYSEHSRARSLLAMMYGSAEPNASSSAPAPYNRREIQALMPEQVQIVQFDALSDKILIWVLSKSQSQFAPVEKNISYEVLSKQVKEYLSLVSRRSSDQEEVRRASMALYEVLIAPIREQLVPGKTICIVSDKILNHLPFEALASNTSGRYLIEDFAVLFAPSSSIFVVSTDAARNKPILSVERLLAVGNPSFDRQAFSSLPNLPSAALEAEEVFQTYDPATSLVLTADGAKKDFVIRAMVNSDVLHFASHYLVDERSPMQSQLLLAKSDARADRADSSGSLFAGDIYKMKLRRPRLAVLSACRTGVERYYNGEGMIGMARTFLAAGVPVVVASQWAVDTVSTNALMVKFHENRRRSGLATTEALRSAQIEIINDSSSPYQHPYYWAPFVTIGGYATY